MNKKFQRNFLSLKKDKSFFSNKKSIRFFKPQNNIFSNKRATIVDMMLNPLFETSLALGVVMMYLLWFISSFTNDPSFEKGFLSTDIALVIDTLILLPGNVDLLYSPHKIGYNNTFNLQFFDNKIEVSQGQNDKHKGIYYFSLKKDTDITKNTFTFNNEDITMRFSKSGKDLIISDFNKEILDFDSNQISCPDINVDLPNKMIIDAGHGFNPTSLFSDAGFIVDELRESELNRQIAFSVFNTAKNFFNVELTRELEPSKLNPDIENAVSEKERMDKIRSSDGFFLSFHLGNYSNKNFIKAFVALDDNLDQSFKLACEIVNSISYNLKNNNVSVNGIAIVPVDLYHNKNNHLNVLSSQKFGVLLEIGSINNPIINNQNNLLISQAIIKGVKNVK